MRATTPRPTPKPLPFMDRFYLFLLPYAGWRAPFALAVLLFSWCLVFGLWRLGSLLLP